MNTVTFDRVQKNLDNTQKIDIYLGESFETCTNIEITGLAKDVSSPFITFLTEKDVCY